MHSCIESASSKIELFTQTEWETVMKTARRKKPYSVTSLNHTFWQKFPAPIKSIRPGRKAGEPVVTDLKHIIYTRGGIFYSLTHGVPLRPLLIGQ